MQHDLDNTGCQGVGRGFAPESQEITMTRPFSAISCQRAAIRVRTGRAAAVLAAGLLAGCAAPAGVQPASLGSNAAPARAVAERPPSLARQGCFAGELGNAPWASRIAEATVHVLEPSGDSGGTKNGSGFVIRDSAEHPGGTNRIVTAGHVVDDVMGSDGLVEVADASGRRIGYAAVVARTARSAGITADGHTLVHGDFAVVEMRGYFNGGRAVLGSIEGMDLGAALPGSAIEGLFSQPAGVVPGASGGPVVDSEGNAIAIMAGSSSDSKTVDGDPMWSSNVRFDAPDGSWAGDLFADMGSKRNVTLPARSHSFAETLGDPTVLAALGPAGQRAQSNPRRGWFKGVSVLGFPANVCITYHADMKPMGMPF